MRFCQVLVDSDHFFFETAIWIFLITCMEIVHLRSENSHGGFSEIFLILDEQGLRSKNVFRTVLQGSTSTLVVWIRLSCNLHYDNISISLSHCNWQLEIGINFKFSSVWRAQTVLIPYIGCGKLPNFLKQVYRFSVLFYCQFMCPGTSYVLVGQQCLPCIELYQKFHQEISMNYLKVFQL